MPYLELFGYGYGDYGGLDDQDIPALPVFSNRAPLAEQVVQYYHVQPGPTQAGRRLRLLAKLARQVKRSFDADSGYLVQFDDVPGSPVYTSNTPLTYGEVLGRLTPDDLTVLPLRITSAWHKNDYLIRSLADIRPDQERDAELHFGLQDLGDLINFDLHEACAAFDWPDLYYPGVDVGIEPVPDAHVQLVIAAAQRELNRELRSQTGMVYHKNNPKLPAVPLAELPFRVQRAYAERRRLRYLQWGVDHAAWERGTYSFWDVLDDSEWRLRK